jgi:hypothetical protein
MKKQVFLSILFAFIILFQRAEAQYDITNYWISKRKDRNYDQLKSTTTYFILPNFCKSEIEMYKKEILPIWTITPLVIVTEDEFKNLALSAKENSILSLELVMMNKTRSGSPSDFYSYLSAIKLRLHIPKIKDSKLGCASVYLYPSISTQRSCYNQSWKINLDSVVSASGEIYNWNVGFVKNYLQNFNETIKSNGTLEQNDKILDLELKKLKTDTLFVPEYLLYQPAVGFRPTKAKYEVSELLNDYPYPYKVISMNEISTKILNSTKPIYYANYTLIDGDTYLYIYNSITGKIVYCKYNSYGVRLKPNNFEKLADKIADFK